MSSQRQDRLVKQRRNPPRKKRFIPSATDWSGQAYQDSIKELVQFETSKGRLTKPIMPIAAENNSQKSLRDSQVNNLLPVQVDVDGGAPQPPGWSGFKEDPGKGIFDSCQSISHSSSLLSNVQTVGVNQPTHFSVDSVQSSQLGSLTQPPSSQNRNGKRKVISPFKNPYEDTKDEEEASDFADEDRRFQVDMNQPVTRLDLDLYRSCPDIANIKPLINECEAPTNDYEQMGDYYRRTKTIPRLLKKISEFKECDCKEVLEILNWDEARLKRRPLVDVGKKKPTRMKAVTSKSFLTTMIHILGRMGKTMASPELGRIDEAVFIRDVGFDRLICMPETRQVTGRAIETALLYYNPIHVFKNMLVDQLIAVKKALKWKCGNRKVDLLEKLIHGWVFGDEDFRKRVFEEVDRVLSFIRIVAPVTPEQRVVSSQVLYRVKGGDGVISDHIKFKVLLTTLRKDLHVYLLCAALPRFRMKPTSDANDDQCANMQLSDCLPQEPPIQLVNCPLHYPSRFELTVNSTKVKELFFMEKREYIPLPITQFCNLTGWNTFHLSFDLKDQEQRWETGILIELVFATARTRVSGTKVVPFYSLC